MNIFSWLFRQRKKDKSKKPTRRLNRLESLESRWMLAGDIPMFDQSSYTVDMDPADVVAGDFSALEQVSATDTDSTELTFSVESTGSGAFFDIDSMDGTISANTELAEDQTYIFDVKVEDESGNSSTASVSVNVPVITPVANDDEASVDSGQTIVIDVLSNDMVMNGSESIDYSSLTIIMSPGLGTANVDSTSGTISFTADSGGSGTDQFQYAFQDTAGTTSITGTVNVTVNEATSDPVIEYFSITFDDNTQEWVLKGKCQAADMMDVDIEFGGDLDSFVFQAQMDGNFEHRVNISDLTSGDNVSVKAIDSFEIESDLMWAVVTV